MDGSDIIGSTVLVKQDIIFNNRNPSIPILVYTIRNYILYHTVTV